ncbi:MAG: hypothetical protein Q9216_004368 [Gyalolechia sp. 2 TL-2023]
MGDMSLFQNLRESIGGYFSPGPSNQPKRTTRSPSPEEVRSRLDRNSGTPSKRTSDWLKAHSVDIKTPKTLGVKGSRVTKHTPSKSQSAKAKSQFWDRVLPKFLSGKSKERSQDDLEGTTLVEDDRLTNSPGFDNEATPVDADITQHAALAAPILMKAEDEDTVYVPTAADLEVMKNWTKDEVWLFYRFNNRGFEPLLPGTWDFDFETVPDKVFGYDDDEVLIKAREGNEYNASRALKNLFYLGSRVRDRITCGFRPEETLRREFLEYYKWSIKDAGLHRIEHIPVLSIGTAAPRESVPSIVGRVTDSLHDLGRQYRAHFFDRYDPETRKPVFRKELPTLYGIVITYSVVSFLTYDSRFPNKPARSMGSFNFAKEDQDVWHAFAAAIVMVKARDYLIGLKEDEQVGEAFEEDETDVDA